LLKNVVAVFGVQLVEVDSGHLVDREHYLLPELVLRAVDWVHQLGRSGPVSILAEDVFDVWPLQASSVGLWVRVRIVVRGRGSASSVRAECSGAEMVRCLEDVSRSPLRRQDRLLSAGSTDGADDR